MGGYTFNVERNENCLVCGRKTSIEKFSTSGDTSLEDMLESFKNKFLLKDANFSTLNGKMIFFENIESCQSLLTHKVASIFSDNQVISVTTRSLSKPFSVKLKF